MKKKIVAILLCASMIFSAVGCGSNSNEQNAQKSDATATEAATSTSDASSTEKEEVKGEPVVIKYGTHWINDLDPNHVDDVTGEYTMGESERQAALAALDAIKNDLNVEFEFIQYSDDVRNELMTSVLAGNPVCDLAIIWGGAEGTILAQNVLQQLDNYSDIFADDETAWMFYDKLYGHNYLLSNVVRFKQRWPLICNLTMLEQVEALKGADGKTVYPMDLFLKGEWTWSTFEDYLSKVDAYYKNVTAPEGCVFDTVQAYETDHRFAGLSAMYSNGGAIYGSDGLEADAANSVKALQYVTNLMDKKLLTDCDVYDDAYTPQWCRGADDFAKGGTVFTDCPDWWIGGNASNCADRGESIGIVPWPREDSLSVDSDEYKMPITLGDSVGVLKGVSEEKTELALKAYALYWTTYYKVLGGVDSMGEYKEVNGLTELAAMGMDVYNETFGQDLIDCFNWISSNLSNDYADLLGIRVTWDDIFGKSIYGVDGFSSYDVAVKANASDFTNVISNMEKVLASNEVKDNQAPSIDATKIVVAAGTKLEDMNFADYYTAHDAVDGDLDMTKATYEVTEAELDLATPGKYSNVVKGIVTDAAGNKAEKKMSIYVYDADNKTAPEVVVKAELPTVKVDTDASSINWKDDFIESATDVSGLDVKDNIQADLSELDTTSAGTYAVAVTVTDYAGNETVVTLDVTVAAAE